MPSSPMFTTPERSETTPPSAAKTSGVAKRSIAAASADHTTTRSRLPSPERVAATAPTAQSTAATIAPQPTRRRPSRTAHAPSPAAPARRAAGAPGAGGGSGGGPGGPPPRGGGGGQNGGGGERDPAPAGVHR